MKSTRTAESKPEIEAKLIASVEGAGIQVDWDYLFDMPDQDRSTAWEILKSHGVIYPNMASSITKGAFGVVVFCPSSHTRMMIPTFFHLQAYAEQYLEASIRHLQADEAKSFVFSVCWCPPDVR